MSYPSLQGTAEFDDVPTTVATLDDVVLQAKALRDLSVRLAGQLDQLALRRRARHQAQEVALNLRTQAAKLDDTLAVHGLLSEPERARDPNWMMGGLL